MDNYTHNSNTIYSFFTYVFAWMSLGLGLTAGTAWYVCYQQPNIMHMVLHSPFIMIGLFALQLGLVFSLYSMIKKLSFVTALFFYSLYAVLNGVIFSGIFLQYTSESIATTFLIGALIFLIMALFGATTRINLSWLGVFFYMMLWGIIISLFVNWYFQNSMVNTVVSGIGVVLFSGLTAYDMQKLSLFAHDAQIHEVNKKQTALLGALMLYLDFINLFLMLLSFTGKRRD